MNVFQESWGQIFNRNKSASKGSKLSPEQCRAAELALGHVPEQCKINYPMLGKQVYDRAAKEFGLDEVLQNMRTIIQSFQEQILELDESFRRMESEQIQEQQEKVFFTPRATKQMFGTDWITGGSTTRETSKKPASGNDDIVSAMHQFTKKIPEVQGKKNYYTRHDLKNRLPRQYGIK